MAKGLLFIVARSLSNIALLVLVTATALRPLIAETHDSANSPLVAALGSEGSPTPLRTLLFDLAMLAAATAALIARAEGPSRTSDHGDVGRTTPASHTGMALGLILLTIASAVSCACAGNKRLALNAAVDWLCHPIAAIALVSLLDRDWRRRLLLAAIVGSACVQAFACYEQSSVGHREAWEEYLKTKSDFWGKQRVALDDPEVELFEARMNAREASGFLSHSNVTASLLVLTGLTAVGVATRAGWRSVLGRNLPLGLLGLAILAAVFLTGSKGATVSLVAAGAVWIGLTRWCHVVALHRRGIFIVSWIAAAIVGAAVIGHGLYHGSLPGASLNFRWQYWTASAGTIAEHPWTGVGRENFGRHYLKYKCIQSPEEVSNPHNVFVQAAAEWGVVGLAGLVAMLIGGSWAMTRGGHATANRGDVGANGELRRAEERQVRTADPTVSGGGSFAWVVAVGVLVVVGRLLLLGSADANYLYYTGMTTALCWFAGAVCVWSARGADGAPEYSRWAMVGGAMGLFAFVLHDTISFAFFVPATATTAFAVFALCVSVGRRDAIEEVGSLEPTLRAGQRRWWAVPTLRGWAPAALCLGATVAVVVVSVIPVARASARLEQARARSTRIDPSSVPASIREVAELYREAAQADPLDPTPHAELANLYRWAAGVGQPSQTPDTAEPRSPSTVRREYLANAEHAVAAAIERDPFSTGLRRLRRSIMRDAAELAGNSPQATETNGQAVAAARDVLGLYPTNPPDWVSLGDTCAAAGQATTVASEEPSPLPLSLGVSGVRETDLSAREYLDEARAAYRKALSLDDARPAWEKYHRMRAKDREEVERKIARIEQK